MLAICLARGYALLIPNRIDESTGIDTQPLFDGVTHMADEQSNEVVRELRKIRNVLAGILLVFALHIFLGSMRFYFESTYRPLPRTQEFRDTPAEPRAGHNELGRQRKPAPVTVPDEKRMAQAGNPGE